jgi:alpha-tubulin suppressor-like RCC1 family protein
MSFIRNTTARRMGRPFNKETPSTAFRRMRRALLSSCIAFGFCAPQFASPASAQAENYVLDTWGANAKGQLGNGTTLRSSVPQFSDYQIKQVAFSTFTIATIDVYGALRVAGNFGNTSFPQSSSFVQIPGSWSSVASGSNYSIALDSNGNLWAWGENAVGQLGNGTTTAVAAPTAIQPPVAGVTFKKIAAGMQTSYAIDASGNMWAWGKNDFGQLGLKTASRTPVLRPTAIRASVVWDDVFAGGSHVAAIATDRSLWTWGNDSSGQLGRTGTTNLPGRVLQAPTPRGYSSSWKVASLGAISTAAIRNDGQLWMWGSGATLTPGPPARFGTDSWADVAVGLGDVLGIHADGTLWSWGQSECGQLGIGNVPPDQSDPYCSYAPPPVLTPTQVGINNNWRGVTASRFMFSSAAIHLEYPV